MEQKSSGHAKQYWPCILDTKPGFLSTTKKVYNYLRQESVELVLLVENLFGDELFLDYL